MNRINFQDLRDRGGKRRLKSAFRNGIAFRSLRREKLQKLTAASGSLLFYVTRKSGNEIESKSRAVLCLQTVRRRARVFRGLTFLRSRVA